MPCTRCHPGTGHRTKVANMPANTATATRKATAAATYKNGAPIVPPTVLAAAKRAPKPGKGAQLHPGTRYVPALAGVVLYLRAQGYSYPSIYGATGATVGTCIWQVLVATWPKGKRLPATTAGVQQAWALGYSWAQVAAACNCTEAQARTLYGNGPAGARGLGNTQGRGGRKPAAAPLAGAGVARKPGPAGAALGKGKARTARLAAPKRAARKAAPVATTRVAPVPPKVVPTTAK